MDSESSVFLSSLPVDSHHISYDVDRLTLNWPYLSYKLKESNLVIDLVNILSGLPSIFFTWTLNKSTGLYEVLKHPLLNKEFDNNVLEMCSPLLEIKIHQSLLLEFVNENRESFLCQALSQEIGSVLDDLQKCVSKFHDLHVQSFLGVEKLSNYLKPAKNTLGILSSVVTGYNSKDVFLDKSNLGILILDGLEERCKVEFGLLKERLQYLLNTCLESYFFLINNYISYSLVNDSVADFFIKAKSDKSLENSNTLNGNDNSDIDKNFKSLSNLELYMSFKFDSRYVPKFFKDLAPKVYEIGLYLRLMGSNLDRPLEFKNLECLISDLNIIHTLTCTRFLNYLRDNIKIFDTFKYFFDFYLFQKSDYIDGIIQKFRDTNDLSQINIYLDKLFNRSKCFIGSDCGYSSQCSGNLLLNYQSPYENQHIKFLFKFDNLSSLTNSLEFYTYYKCEDSNKSNGIDSNLDINDQNDGDIIDSDLSILELGERDYSNLVLCCKLDDCSKVIFIPELIYKYQICFKLLFQLKYVEQCLNDLSLYHSKSSQLPIEPDLVPQFNLQLFTVSKMQNFIRILVQHYLLDVVSTNIMNFLQKNYNDINSLKSSHMELIESLIDNLALNKPELLGSLQLILLLLFKFSTEIMRFIESPCFSVDLPNDDEGNDNFESLNRFRKSLEKRTITLNSLLRNPGYQNVLLIASSEFEKNLKKFKSLLNKTNLTLKNKFH